MKPVFRIKSIFRLLITIFLLVILTIAACNVWIIRTTEPFIFTSIQDLPANDVALLLGTSKYSIEGRSNPYFSHRMEAAAKLYYYKKIKHIIVSGDNSLSYYNEPADMKKALLNKGVPDSVITLDYAGFRTFDSVVRSKEVFNQKKITIITQRFHLYRALFIGKHYNMDAVGFAAANIEENKHWSAIGRENLARFLAVLDLYVFNKEPKFLGKKESISL